MNFLQMLPVRYGDPVAKEIPILGVVLINTGSPAAPTPEAVGAYLGEFLMDEHICPLPLALWSPIVRHAVLPRRSVASARKYQLIWGEQGSPLVAGCMRLVQLAEAELRRRGVGSDGPGGACEMGAASPLVRAAMLYGEPSLVSALTELRDAGCTQLVALPLYPQRASSTTGAARSALDRELARIGWSPQVVCPCGYGDRPAYLVAVAGAVRAAGYDPERDHLLCSFHAVPLSDERRGDGYERQAARAARGVAELVGAPRGTWGLAFQSPFEDGRRWTGPSTRRRVEELARVGNGRLVVACPGFAVDCLETLYDVEHEFRQLFLSARPGSCDRDFVYVPCLNDAPAHVELLADVVEDAFGTLIGD